MCFTLYMRKEPLPPIFKVMDLEQIFMFCLGKFGNYRLLNLTLLQTFRQACFLLKFGVACG
jgi:hypothetical protein